jgi:hypothetical protein
MDRGSASSLISPCSAVADIGTNRLRIGRGGRVAYASTDDDRLLLPSARLRAGSTPISEDQGRVVLPRLPCITPFKLERW